MSRKATVVIGAGHNGLTTAILLAKAGHNVTVVEAREQSGGLASSESYHEGFRTNGVLHDTRTVRRKVTDNLGLSGHGLRWQTAAPVVAVGEGGRTIVIDRSRRTIEGASDHDQKAYQEYLRFVERLRPLLSKVLDQPPLNPLKGGLRSLLQLGRTGLTLRRLGKNDMRELLRIGPMCIADWFNDQFEDELLKATLALPSLTASFLGPWSAGSTLAHLLHEGIAGDEIVGGPAALTQALLAAAKAAGVTIKNGATVKRIEIERNRVTAVNLGEENNLPCHVVAASCDPKTALLGLMPPRRVPAEVTEAVRLIRQRGTTAKIDFALSAVPKVAGKTFSVLRICESIDNLERAFDALKYGAYAEAPALDCRLNQDGHAPAGQASLSVLVNFASYDLKGGWDDDAKAKLCDIVVERLQLAIPDIEGMIVGRKVHSPADIAADLNLWGGNLYHGEHALDQLLFMRPAAALSQYSTPIEGLFLCGSGCHPGGGLTCVPGSLAAQEILRTQ